MLTFSVNDKIILKALQQELFHKIETLKVVVLAFN